MSLVICIVLVTSIWVWIDARTLGVKKGQVEGFFNMTPFDWFIACILFWIIAFPAYLAKRPQYKQAAVAVTTGTASRYIQRFFIIIFAIAAAYSTLKGAINGLQTTEALVEIPPCKSEEFNFAVSKLLEDEMGLKVYEVEGVANPLSLPHENYVNEDTGEEFSNCIAMTKTSAGRVAFDVMISQTTPDSMVYIEAKEIPYEFPKGY